MQIQPCAVRCRRILPRGAFARLRLSKSPTCHFSRAVALTQAKGAMIERHQPETSARRGPQTAAWGQPGISNEGMIFATGIENSNPTIDNGRVRIDEMESCGHYKLWSTDFEKVQEMGISFLRYDPPLHTTFLGPQRYDWSFTDTTLADLQKRKIIPIMDLCH